MKDPKILKENIVASAKMELGRLLTRNIDDLIKAYEDWLLNKPEPRPGRRGKMPKEQYFSSPLSLRLAPRGNSINVKVAIAYGTKRKDETGGQLAEGIPQSDLFDDKDDKKGGKTGKKK